MIRRIFVSFGFLICSLCSFGGEVDSNYVAKFKNIFAVKGFLINNGFIYTLTPRNNSFYSPQQLKDAEVIYSAHIPTTAGVSLNIKGVGFTYVFKFTDDYLDTTGRVRSGFKQFQMNIYGNKFGFEGYYQDYSRFYFHYKGDEILLKNYNNDIRAYQFGANGIFIFNGHKFSYNAAFNQTQFQKKSAGSGLMMISLKYNELQSNHLIPDSVDQFFSGYSALQKNRNYGFLLQGGYAFNLTKKNFYYSTALLAGAGIQFQSYSFPIDKFYKIGFPLIGRVKSSMGYNGKVFFTGIFGNFDVSQSYIHSVKTQQLIYSYGVYVGFRAIEMQKYKKSRKQLQEEAKEKKAKEAAAKKKLKEDKKKAAKEKKRKK
ncbi:MAG TPA: DUF4421 family protein [Bacteroidia bacterium]|jgi:hypothetical protein